MQTHLLIDARRGLSRQHLSALAGAGSLLCAALAAHRLATADVCGCMTDPAGATRIVKQGRLAELQRAPGNNRAMAVEQGRRQHLAGQSKSGSSHTAGAGQGPDGLHNVRGLDMR